MVELNVLVPLQVRLGPGWNRFGSVRLVLVGVERSAVTETELSDVLVACPRCHTWPMSVNFGRSNRFEWAHRDLGLRCPACGHRENALIDDQGAISGRSSDERRKGVRTAARSRT